jgi:lincosamide nucleotidyltransferase A/C/D/E
VTLPMGSHLMSAESATRLLAVLGDRGVDPSVGGGWAVDALLGEQTREHSDLDLWIRATDAEPLFTAFASIGLDRVFPWPGDRPWNFVLHDGGTLRVDLHFYEVLADGDWHYGGAAGGERFPSVALDGGGVIGGVDVRCDAPEWSIRWHTGYDPRSVDRHDVPLLCDRFGIALPEEYR